jgi:hypothetical protein
LTRRIEVVKYKYKIGDLVKFTTFNGNANFRDEIIGVVVKRNLLSCFWYEEAEKKVFQSGREFLVYEVVHEGSKYSVKEAEIIEAISSKDG